MCYSIQLCSNLKTFFSYMGTKYETKQFLFRGDQLQSCKNLDEAHCQNCPHATNGKLWHFVLKIPKAFAIPILNAFGWCSSSQNRDSNFLRISSCSSNAWTPFLWSLTWSVYFLTFDPYSIFRIPFLKNISSSY